MDKKEHVIIFDFDGVIVDSIGVMLEDMQKLYPGLTREALIEASKNSIEERNEILDEKYGVADAKHTAQYRKEFAEHKNKSGVIHRGMKVVLKELHEKFYIGLNTNSSESGSIPILKKHGLFKHFDLIQTADDSSSKVDKSEQIMSELGVTPAECIFVTDTAGDVLDAEEAGMSTIAVTWGVSLREDFEEGEVGDGVIGIVDSSEELYDAISEYFK